MVPLVWQILIALVVVVGLITIIMSVKNWHWAQMLLLLGVFFLGLTVLILGMEVFRIHRNLRAGMPQKEQQADQLEEVVNALEHGTGDPTVISRAFPGEPPFDLDDEGRMPGKGVWRNRLEVQARERGRVWRGVKASGPVDPATGRIPVTIAAPQPHGLEENAIVFAFEQGAPNGATPEQGAQYLGEFKVAEVREDGVTLESVRRLNERTGGRLLRSAQNPQVSWSLYETMPSDSHALFADKGEEELNQLLPPASVGEYLRHGQPPTPDDDEYERAAFNEKGERVALDDPDKAEERYDRPLRDYAYLFAELTRQRTLLQTEKEGLILDNDRLKAAQQNALQLTAHREQELEALEKDLQFMKRDQAAIEAHLQAILARLENRRQMAADLIPENARLAAELIQRQTGRLRELVGGAVAGNAGL